MTTVRLALGGDVSRLLKGWGYESLEQARSMTPKEILQIKGEMTRIGRVPAFLSSYAYRNIFEGLAPYVTYSSWVLDSGAFTAHASGKDVRLEDFIAYAKASIDSPRPPAEVFALDVIGNWKASLKNCEVMWKHGVEAIPCYHVGSPANVLTGIARDYPKIALGGAVGYKGKLKWAESCFAQVWPVKIHGFGFGSEKDILHLPWHSTDASNWELGPSCFGRWASYGGTNPGLRGATYRLGPEIDHYIRIEKRAKAKWGKVLAELK